MRSKGHEEFNHDPWADTYDEEVRDENHPIRAGYREAIEWVAGQAAMSRLGDMKKQKPVYVDLGSGTGNLTEHLPDDAHIICVDVSAAMLKIAREKLKSKTNLEFVREDILQYVLNQLPEVDGVVSTYALHHLTASEKAMALGAISARLKPGGFIAVGDLMFEDNEAKNGIVSRLKSEGHEEAAADIDEEFFWSIDQEWPVLEDLGFDIDSHRFSDLSWGFCARLN